MLLFPKTCEAMLLDQGGADRDDCWWMVEFPGDTSGTAKMVPYLARCYTGDGLFHKTSLACSHADLPRLEAEVGVAELFPLSLRVTDTPFSHTRFLRPADKRPVLLTITPEGTDLTGASPLEQHFRAPSGKRLVADLGRWTVTEDVAEPVRRLHFHMRERHHGAAAVAPVLGAVRMVIAEAMRCNLPRPLLVRIDAAGLGLGRATLRRLETHLDAVLGAYEAEGGCMTVALMERGLLADHADAAVTLPPGQACRMDLRLPRERRIPTSLRVRQSGDTGPVPDIGMDLRAPDGICVEAHSGARKRTVTLDSLTDGTCAAVVPGGPGRGRGAVDHVFVFAPTTATHDFGRCRALDGIWEVTVTNRGTVPAHLSLMLQDAVSLLPGRRAPRAWLGRSHSLGMDFAMLDSARPEFCEMRDRLEALIERADVLPLRILRRAMEPGSWPIAHVYAGSAVYRLECTETQANTGGALRMRPAVSARVAKATCAEPAGGDAMDVLLRSCLEAISADRPVLGRKKLVASLLSS